MDDRLMRMIRMSEYDRAYYTAVAEAKLNPLELKVLRDDYESKAT
jgi:hypothetical protein